MSAGAGRRRVVPVLAAGAFVVVALTQRQSLLLALGRAAHSSPPLLALAVVLEVVSLIAAAELLRLLLSASGVRARSTTMLGLVWASNAVGASLPAGAAASAVYSYRQLNRRGTPPAVAGWLLGVSGALSAAGLALLVVAGAQLRGIFGACTAEDFVEVTLLLGLVAAGVGLLGWLSADPQRLGAVHRRVQRASAAVARLGHRSPSGPSTLPSIELRGTGWVAATLLAVLNWAADGAVLAISVAAVGGHLRWSALVLAYALSQVAASLPLLPGSLGIAEGSLVVVLTCAGLRTSDALAATLVYRTTSFWLQLLPGCAAWVRLRHARPFDLAASPSRAVMTRPTDPSDGPKQVSPRETWLARPAHALWRTPRQPHARPRRQLAEIGSGYGRRPGSAKT